MRIEMPEKRKKYYGEFREGAVRIVEETNKPIAGCARPGRERGHLGQQGEPCTRGSRGHQGVVGGRRGGAEAAARGEG
jgi:transposase